MSPYGPEFRRQLRASIISTGVPPARADQAVDLACHAADRARETFADVVKRSPDTLVALAAAEIGAQLAASHFRSLFEGVHEMGRAAGLPTAQCRAELGK